MLMFDKSQVEAATHPLVRILRHIFYKKKITLDNFSTLYAQHGKRLGLAPHVTNTNRNNARKALNHVEKITFVLFRYILYNVLHEEVVEFSVTIKNLETGELVTYKNTDPID
jgi:hypothetical protein